MDRNARLVAFTPKLITVLREGYSADRMRRDCIAGLTVAIVALPLAMALAIASGASPDKGLITAVIAGFLISALGGSRVQVGGPTGAFVVVVFGVIAQHGYDGLLLATLMAGLMLIIAGYSGLGSLVRFIPQPVVIGFTAGIAVIIASSQVKDFLGLRIDGGVPADFIPKWQAYFSALGSIQILSLAIGAGSLALIIALRKWAPRAPGFLIAVILAAASAALLSCRWKRSDRAFQTCLPEFLYPPCQISLLPSFRRSSPLHSRSRFWRESRHFCLRSWPMA